MCSVRGLQRDRLQGNQQKRDYGQAVKNEVFSSLQDA